MCRSAFEHNELISMFGVLEAQNASLRALVSDLTSQTSTLRERIRRQQGSGPITPFLCHRAPGDSNCCVVRAVPIVLQKSLAR
jgi:hypothetical protein